MNILRYLLMRGRTLRNKTVVHVGAHYGEEAEHYQNWGAATVVWFEAAPDIFAALQTHLASMEQKPRSLFCRLTGQKRTRHIAVRALVGGVDGGTAEFHLFDNDGSSNSIFKMKRGENERFPQVRETGEVLELPMRTLDAALDDVGIPPETIDVLVLDVQGAELMCLQGAKRTLAAIDYLESEVSVEPVYEGGVLLSELEPWLEEHGFKRATAVRKNHMNAIYRKMG
ncbi:methyltransferase, FkbM family [Hoeflea phototrophica DFL-43]|uniref:Methyltransferase, FkbM family n=1 Tax=Hoeflea phototrophica (strain DSM 17068 / NCIMB 14078 / DFL-43) TaxID=411684 RepID=A9CXM5_HOEPD|nr:FkbM family methyltransferase [Hoeflea phototrophica]EDQ35688.1 methyltransferase, FkbM family [Hoeflea phototrophica DFL-43]